MIETETLASLIEDAQSIRLPRIRLPRPRQGQQDEPVIDLASYEKTLVISAALVELVKPYGE